LLRTKIERLQAMVDETEGRRTGTAARINELESSGPESAR
jgi:hypothetical protein